MTQFNRMPSDHPVATCWTCRKLTEQAAKLQIRPAAYKLWREELWSSFGYGALAAVFAAFVMAIFGLAVALLNGAEVERVADVTVGMFLLGFSLSCAVLSVALWLRAMAKLRKLKYDREVNT